MSATLSETRLAAMRAHAREMCNGTTPEGKLDVPFVKAVNHGSAGSPYVAHAVMVSGDQTLCIVPPDDKAKRQDNSEGTARAIAAAGKDLFDALAEIERLRDENEHLQRYWNETLLALQSQIQLAGALVTEHEVLMGKYTEPLKKLMQGAQTLFSPPTAAGRP